MQPGGPDLNDPAGSSQLHPCDQHLPPAQATNQPVAGTGAPVMTSFMAGNDTCNLLVYICIDRAHIVETGCS